MQHSRANNKIIRQLITYVKDDLDLINCEIVNANKKHIKPKERNIDTCMNHIESLLKGIKNEFKFEKKG